MRRPKLKLLALAATLMALSGCGLAETGATAAAGGTAEAQQAKQAKAIEAKMQQQVNSAVQEDAARRKAA
jgi:outer membrane lipoprotein-sorting protein